MYFVLKYSVSDGYTYSTDLVYVFNVESEEALLSMVLEAYEKANKENLPELTIDGLEITFRGDYNDINTSEEFMDHVRPADVWLAEEAKR